MAVVPGYIYIGDEMINGGESGVAPVTNTNVFAPALAPVLWGVGTGIPLIQRVVPSGPDGVTGGLYDCYYDGLYRKPLLATGGGASTIVRTGSNWVTNMWVGRSVNITAGTGSGQTRSVASNTGDTVTVSSAWATPPDATSVFNFGDGALIPFKYIPDYEATLNPTGARGDNWYGLPTFSPNAMLMQKLHQWHGNVPPGFRMLKSAAAHGIGGWKTGQSSWTSLLANWNHMKNLVTSEGNTLELRAIIIDAMATDIFAVNLALQADLDAFIDSVRADLSTTALIIIVNQNERLNQTSFAPVAPGLRGVVRSVVEARKLAGDTLIRTYDMSWATFAFDAAPASNTQVPADPRYYDMPSVIMQGVGLFNTIRGHYTPSIAPSGPPIAGALMIGDSQLVGQSISTLIAFHAKQESVTGPDITQVNTTQEGVWIWDEAGQQLVPYNVITNSNTYPSLSGFGPDVTLGQTLRKRFTDGVAIFKYAKGGTSLTPEGNNGAGYVEKGGALWDEIVDRFHRFLVSGVQTLGRRIDMVGGLISMGENDAGAGAGAVLSYTQRGPTWIDDIRENFSTRIDKFLPLAWIQGAPPAVDVDGGTNHSQPADRRAYRAALESFESLRPHLKVLRNSGPNDYELSYDYLHYGGLTLFKIGKDAGEAILQIIDDSAEGATTTEATSSPSGTATFVVESGSGAADSNAYCTVAFADALHAQLGNPIEWLQASILAKQDAIRQATDHVDRTYGAQFDGARLNSTQALEWPRYGAEDRNGWFIASNAVPVAVQKATAYRALMVLNGDAEASESQSDSAIKSTSYTSPAGSETIVYAGTSTTATSKESRVQDFLAPVMAGGGGGMSFPMWRS